MKIEAYLKCRGVFESMRSLNGKIVYFDAHLERLARSCSLIKLKLPLTPAELKAEISRAISFSQVQDNYIKLTVRRCGLKSGYSVLVKEYMPQPAAKYESGFRAAVAARRQDTENPLAQVKSIDRVFYESGFREAKARGLDEAIILNSYGYIAEGTRSNVFIAKNQELFTPELDCGCLDGVTRRVIFDLARKAGINVFEAKITLKDLYCSDEAFLTNSLIGVMPLVSAENRKVGNRKAGKLIKWLIKKYNSLLN